MLTSVVPRCAAAFPFVRQLTGSRAHRSVQLWRVNFPGLIVSFQPDPFNATKCTFAGSSGSISFATGIANTDTPSIASGYRLSPPTEANGGSVSIHKHKSSAVEVNTAGGISDLAPTPGAALVGEAPSVVRHMVMSSSRRHIAYFVTAKHILVFDMSIRQALASIPVERGRPR